MKQAEFRPKKSGITAWRIFFILLVVALIIAIILVIRYPRIITILSESDSFFPDNVIAEASGDLENAEARIERNPSDESAHLERARAYLLMGHLEGARLEWEQWHERGSGEWGEIARALDELQLKTDEIRALLHDAETSSAPAEQYPPIYTLLDDIAERFEGIPRYRALFLKGYLLLREARRAEARPIFEEELDQYSILDDYVAYNFARSLIVSGSEDEALDEFARFLEEFPTSRLAPLAHLERINILREQERLEDAIAECRRALDSYPTGQFAPKTLRKWAEIYESELDFDNGALRRVEILANFPESDEARDTIDMFFGGVYSTGLLSESDRLVTAYAAIDSHTSDAFEILSDLAESSALTPEERARACHGAARCEYAYGRYYECIEWAERARDFAPGSEWADRAGIRIGHAYWRLDKIDLAKQAYRDVVTGHGPIASTAAEILWNRAYADYDLETTGDACRYVVEEYPASDETPAAMTMLAYLGCRGGEYQSAKGYAERCINAFPDSPAAAEAAFWLARALEGLGRNVESRQTYEQVARNTPWNYWGIRAREITMLSESDLPALDPFQFDPGRISLYSGALAKGWELYDAGTLDLAEEEFILADKNGQHGALCGLALAHAEQGRMRQGVVVMRDAVAVGDQAYITPQRQIILLDELYPRPYVDEIRAASLAHDIPPAWLWGAMRQESCFNPRALSSSGARGLIQIMPETGRWIADRRGAETFDPEVLWDPAVNIDYGAWYFDYLRSQVGGSKLLDILAAYNGGPGKLRTWKSRLPIRDDDIFVNAIPQEETRNFARWVYANVRIYEAFLESQNFQLAPE